MFWKIFAPIVTFGYVLLFNLSSPMGDNLLVNPSFEEDFHQTFKPDIVGEARMEVIAEANHIPGWQVPGGKVSWSKENHGDDPNEPALGPKHSDFFIDLTNRNESGPYGGVKQGVWLDSNSRYEISLYVGSSRGVRQTDPQHWGGPVTVFVTVTASGGRSVQHECRSNPPMPALHWEPCKFTFRPPGLISAGGAPVQIQIAAPQNQRKKFIGVDNVTLHRFARSRFR